MCFGTLPASTIISAYFLSSLSHSLCIGLPCLLDEVRWIAFFWKLSVLLSGPASGGLHICFQISQIVHLVLPVSVPGVSFATLTDKTWMWVLSRSSLMVLFALQPTRRLQSKEWLGISGAVGRRALDVGQGMNGDCLWLRTVCSLYLFFLRRFTKHQLL